LNEEFTLLKDHDHFDFLFQLIDAFSDSKNTSSDGPNIEKYPIDLIAKTGDLLNDYLHKIIN